jgi:hypothetical protein
MADAGIGEMMLLGAALGGGTAAATKGDIGQGALMGGALGGLGGAGAGMLGAGEAAGVAGTAGMGGMDAYMASAGMAPGAFEGAAFAMPELGGIASGFGPGWSSTGFNQGAADLTLANQAADPIAAMNASQGWTGAAPNVADQAKTLAAQNQAAKSLIGNPEFMKNPLDWMQANPVKTAMAGAGIFTLANYLKGGALTKPNTLPAYNPVTAQSMGLGRTLASNYQRGTAHAAGGLMSSPPTPGLMDNGASGNVDFMGGDMYPQSQIHRSYYATPTQMPTSAQAAMASYEPKTNPLTGQATANMASGGIADLGSYSDGGRMLKGPGDGMSDNIPATIGGKQPARLADGEFVVPADVVSHLGNGSTDAGAKQLYSMMNKVRQARTGTKKQGREINPKKYLKA